MTTSEASAPVGDVDPGTDVRTLSDQLPRFVRLAQALKQQMVSEGRERAARVLLFPIAKHGPMRQGALADLMHTDPSTTSRHVAWLVEKGLVRRVADEADGRASRLMITENGHQALQELCAEREAAVARATADWDPQDLATFIRLFGRLIDDMETALLGSAPASPTLSPRRTS